MTDARTPTPESVACDITMRIPSEWDWDTSVEAKIAAALRQAKADTLAEVEAMIVTQPFYPDTHTGMRQQWLKDELLTKVRGMRTKHD